MKWNEILPEDAMLVADRLTERAARERMEGKRIFPPQEQIFRALQLTPPDKVKAVIIGQDPYHTPGQANGLAFSIRNGNPMQPSLANIFAELAGDLAVARPTTTDLTPWAERGVLLLNSVLTVHERQANSNADWGWQAFTSAVLERAAKLPQPVVFMLWGANAARIMPPLPHGSNKMAIRSTHPSPFSAAKGTPSTPSFMGSRPFSRANAFLQEHGVGPIDWRLP